MKKIIKRFKIIRGKLRLLWGFCPECNSDAPKLYDCKVCRFYRGEFPPDKITKNEWWYNFKSQFMELDLPDVSTKL